nr:MAG TPA: hypothetical protein [Bacteriophage sp.]
MPKVGTQPKKVVKNRGKVGNKSEINKLAASGREVKEYDAVYRIKG